MMHVNYGFGLRPPSCVVPAQADVPDPEADHHQVLDVDQAEVSTVEHAA